MHVRTEQDAVTGPSEEEHAYTWSGVAHPATTADAVRVQLVVAAPPDAVACSLSIEGECVRCGLAAPGSPRVEVSLSLHHDYSDLASPRGVLGCARDSGATSSWTTSCLSGVPLKGLFARAAVGDAPLLGIGRAASGVAQASVQGLAGLSGRVWDAARHTAHAVGHARARSEVPEGPTAEQRVQRDAALHQVWVVVWGAAGATTSPSHRPHS